MKVCPNCGKKEVHVATSGIIIFWGDQDDDDGSESDYAEEPFEPEEDVTLAALICHRCGHLVDVWFTSPLRADAPGGKE